MRKLLIQLFLLAPLGLASQTATAIVDFCDTVEFPDCIIDFGNCEFDLDYGETGVVRALGALHYPGEGVLINPQIEVRTDLALSCTVTGAGTSYLRVSLEFFNTGVTPTPPMKYFAFMNPDGNATSLSALLNDIPTASFFSPGTMVEPVAYGFDDLANLNALVPGNLDHDVFNLVQLPNTNYCAPLCNVVAALQWDIDPLEAGESVVVSMGYSDAGIAGSGRFLTIERADDSGVPDDPNTVLTVSGELRSLPGLGVWGLPILAGLLAAAGSLASRRRSRFSNFGD